jgi:hypothetical protein
LKKKRCRARKNYRSEFYESVRKDTERYERGNEIAGYAQNQHVEVCHSRREKLPGVFEENRKGEVKDDTVIGLIGKEVKRREESIEAYVKAGRDELVAQETWKWRYSRAIFPKNSVRTKYVQLR